MAQTVVITGSSKGIGRGLALEFARRGMNVVVTGSSEQSLAEALAIIGEQPGSVAGFVCDVSQQPQVQALWDFAVQQFGRVDIWVNNAGLARTIWAIADTPADDARTMVETNLLGGIFGSQVAATGLVAQGGGKIFNVLGGGSDGDYRPGMGIYGSTKRGLDYLNNALAKELSGTGVIVNKIRPGMLITEGVMREAKADPENFAKHRKVMNILCDTVETVAPYLVDKMLAANQSGKKIAWLSGAKIGARFMRALWRKPADKFADFGL